MRRPAFEDGQMRAPTQQSRDSAVFTTNHSAWQLPQALYELLELHRQPKPIVPFASDRPIADLRDPFSFQTDVGIVSPLDQRFNIRNVEASAEIPQTLEKKMGRDSASTFWRGINHRGRERRGRIGLAKSRSIRCCLRPDGQGRPTGVRSRFNGYWGAP